MPTSGGRQSKLTRAVCVNVMHTAPAWRLRIRSRRTTRGPSFVDNDDFPSYFFLFRSGWGLFFLTVPFVSLFLHIERFSTSRMALLFWATVIRLRVSNWKWPSQCSAFVSCDSLWLLLCLHWQLVFCPCSTEKRIKRHRIGSVAVNKILIGDQAVRDWHTEVKVYLGLCDWRYLIRVLLNFLCSKCYVFVKKSRGQ